MRLLAILALLVATIVATPAAADHVEPTVVGGNPTCGPEGRDSLNISDYELKIDEGGDNPVPSGTYTKDFTDGEGNTFTATVTIVTSADGKSVDFHSASPNVLAAVAKGGPQGAHLYDYRPEGTTEDTGLTTPGNHEISHLSFCFDEPLVLEGTLDVEKTAIGSFNRDITWNLTKTVAPDSHAGGPGDTFTSDWQVVATKTISDPQNYKVEGVITVGWSGNFAVSVRVEDELDDGTPVAVDCDGNGGDVIHFSEGTAEETCTYEVLTDDDSAETNHVELIVLGEPEGDIDGTLTAEADIVWTEGPATGDASVLLEDDRKPHSETISETTTLDYDEVFACPAADSGLYQDGLYEETFPNTATLTGEDTGTLTADASVTLTCTLPPMEFDTAWASNELGTPLTIRYTPRGNWATYVEYEADKTTTLYAGQTNDAGTVHFSAPSDGLVTITVTLKAGWSFEPGVANLAVQGYDSAPSGNPAPGQFDDKKECMASPCSITVPLADFYGVHANVGS